jgi:hypothetical protein
VQPGDEPGVIGDKGAEEGDADDPAAVAAGMVNDMPSPASIGARGPVRAVTNPEAVEPTVAIVICGSSATPASAGLSRRTCWRYSVVTNSSP